VAYLQLIHNSRIGLYEDAVTYIWAVSDVDVTTFCRIKLPLTNYFARSVVSEIRVIENFQWIALNRSEDWGGEGRLKIFIFSAFTPPRLANECM